jgi:K+-sensing histidine kinase KdpD
LFGFWTPLFFLGAIYFAWRRLEYQQRRRSEYELKMMETERSRRSDYEIERLQRDLRSSVEFLQKSFESKLEDLGPRIRDSVEAAVEDSYKNASISRFAGTDRALLSVAGTAALETQRRPSEDAPLLIREISHALNTPLSHIEAALLTLEPQATATEDGGDIQERLRDILTSVQACKSIIAGFREVILAARSTTTWSPPSLRGAISSIALLSAGAAGRGTTVTVDLPDSVPEFSNNYLVAVLLPLIENAAESGQSHSVISISSRRSGNTYFFDVTSKPDALPKSDEIYDDGFTTKAGHTGTGLSIVRRLISGRQGARVAHKITGKDVTFTVTLPLAS